MKIFYLLLLISINSLALEYRLEDKEKGVTFKWDKTDKALRLAKKPFLISIDFKEAKVVKTRIKNLKNIYDVKIMHSLSGRKKIQEMAAKSRDERYCIVFKNLIRQCYAFAPKTEDVFTLSSSIYGNSTRAQAQKMVDEINLSLE